MAFYSHNEQKGGYFFSECICAIAVQRHLKVYFNTSADYSGVPNKHAARLFNCEKFFHPSHSY